MKNIIYSIALLTLWLSPITLGTPIRILSLDGGGIRGIMSAQVLEFMENEIGPIHKKFDVIVGTSTGGVLALGLTTPKADKTALFKASQLVDLYSKKGNIIFDPRCPLVSSMVCGLSGPRYSVDEFEKYFKRILGPSRLGEALTTVVVTSFEMKNSKPHEFSSLNPKHQDLLVRELARATSAAPTYFRPASVSFPNGNIITGLVDGGLYRNDPVMIGFRTALNKFTQEEIQNRGLEIYSIGTGQGVDNAINENQLDDAGFITWAPLLIESLMSGNSMGDQILLSKEIKKSFNIAFNRLQFTLDTKTHPESLQMDNISKENITYLLSVATEMINSAAYKKVIKMLKS